MDSSSRRTSPTQEEIRARAYEIYLERGGRPGDPENDWLRAERELSGRAGTPQSGSSAGKTGQEGARDSAASGAPAAAGKQPENTPPEVVVKRASAPIKSGPASTPAATTPAKSARSQGRGKGKPSR